MSSHLISTAITLHLLHTNYLKNIRAALPFILNKINLYSLEIIIIKLKSIYTIKEGVSL